MTARLNLFGSLVVLALFVHGCSSSSNHQSTSRELLPEPDRLERIHGEKHNLDNRISAEELTLEVYAKTEEGLRKVDIRDLNWPEETTAALNLWRDSTNGLVCLAESPGSQSGDWSIGMTHYFDKKGSTFAYERATSFFNSICTDEVAVETISLYYHNGSLIDSTYTLTDTKGGALERDSCQFPYDYPYEVFSDTSKLLRAVGLKTDRG